MSRDLEDIVALLDGCLGLNESLATAVPELRSFVAAMLKEILTNDALIEIALGQLPIGGDIAARERRLIETMRRVIELGGLAD